VLAGLVVHDAVGRHLAGMVSGLDIRYDVGPGTHPLLGRRLPHTRLATAAGPADTTALLRTGRGLLLDLADDAGLRRAAAAWSDRLTVVTGAPQPAEDAAGSGGAHRTGRGGVPAGTGAVLVRPDGHVAWASPGSGLGVEESLARWFGPARRPAPAAAA
jgi:bifunctional hydroxylase/dehydrase